MKPLKLQTKINVAIIAAFILVILLFSGMLRMAEQKNMRNLTSKIEVLLQTLVARDQEDLADELFEKRYQATSLRVKQMLKVNGILNITVFDSVGDVFVSNGAYPNNLKLSGALKNQARQQHQIIEYQTWQDQDVLRYVEVIQVIGETQGYIQIYYSLDDLKHSQRMNRLLLFGALVSVLLLMLLLLNLFLNRSIIKPILLLRDSMRDVENSLKIPRDDSLSFDELRETMLNFGKISEHLVHLTRMYRLFVPHSLLDYLSGSQRSELTQGGSTQQVMTVLLGKIYNLSSQTQGIADDRKLALLNQYLEMVCPLLREQGGWWCNTGKIHWSQFSLRNPMMRSLRLCPCLRLREAIPCFVSLSWGSGCTGGKPPWGALGNLRVWLSVWWVRHCRRQRLW
ncbi:hypothetical protein [Dongshaea marina]|uniref:hypothetical protein n=1 Tax=Dongshaea marina TaxID=2047966 RepID=UPI000D3E457E|nr:hypothetical protein [Dongshaea marina]